ncbi:hypothetical protein BD560DRAFT_429021 [Blakeslea trispora]|nr:hypothetical protein BD560DRAFT_429021 [Blakeslea trispora]
MVLVELCSEVSKIHLREFGYRQAVFHLWSDGLLAESTTKKPIELKPMDESMLNECVAFVVLHLIKESVPILPLEFEVEPMELKVLQVPDIAEAVIREWHHWQPEQESKQNAEEQLGIKSLIKLRDSKQWRMEEDVAKNKENIEINALLPQKKKEG